MSQEQPENNVEVTIVNANPQTQPATQSELDEIRRETQALIDALKTRAQLEAQSAGEMTREAYLTAVRQARQLVEENRLFDPEQLEKSVQWIQQEADRNWNQVVSEVESFGDRLSEAALAAWEKLAGKAESAATDASDKDQGKPE